MDFFERQDRAQRKTKLLVVYFLLAITTMVGALYLLVVGSIFGTVQARTPDKAKPFAEYAWQPDILLGVAGVTILIIAIGSVYKVLQLRQGGGVTAQRLGGRPVNPNTEDPHERKLLNIVEEMAIASGTPVPEVYIINGEKSINAFASGHDISDAAIGVTRGCIELLDRDELQGVIAHEFSHIFHGDMKLNLRLMGLLNGLLCLAILGRVLLYAGSSSSRSTSGRRGSDPRLLIFALGLIVIGWVGVLFGKLIKSAVSRQREFLADSAAVQYTRNPAGLSGALKKIGGLAYGSRVRVATAEEASHMFFGNALANQWTSLLATHPPLDQRIRALDPQFDGSFPKVEIPDHMRPPPIEPQFTRQTGRQVRPAATNDLVGLFDNQRGSAPQEQIVGQIGGISTVHLHFAAEFLENLPARIREAAHDPFGACALIYGLLLSPDKKARDKQWEHLNQHGNPEVLHELERLREAVLQLPAEAKLPIMDLTLPALRQMSAAQYGKFRPNLQALVEADQEIDLFEYALLKVMTHHLEPVFHPKSAKKVTRYHSFKALEHECAVLLAGMAHVGHPEEERERQIAFQSGKALLGSSGAGCQWLPFESCNLKEMDGALDRLSGASPGIKRRFIRALAATAACDGTIQRKEGELLRAVADSLDCPIPPFVRPDAVQS